VYIPWCRVWGSGFEVGDLGCGVETSDLKVED